MHGKIKAEGRKLLNKPRTIVLFSAVALMMVTLLIVPLYQFMDLDIARAAHTLKGTAWVSVGKIISWLASKHVIQSAAFLALLTGAVDALIYGLSIRARSILLVAVSVISAMLIGDELKWFFGRCRPPMFFEDGAYGFTWFSDKYLENSFPSGHTLRAFSLATALAFVMPRRKYIPLIVALLVGVSRVVVGRHYPSDVLFGCFIGVTCAVWCHYFLFPVEWSRNKSEN